MSGVGRELERLLAQLRELAARVSRIGATSPEDALLIADEAADIAEYAAALRAKPVGVALTEGRRELASIREHVEALERERVN